jgi:group I intron endonuclease
MKTGIIYRVTSPSGRVYIGQTRVPFKRRKYEHIHHANLIDGNLYSTRFSAAIRKYGDELVWEIIHKDIEVSLLNELEESEIIKHDSFNSGYNSTPIAFGGGFAGKNHTDSAKAILSEKRCGDKNPMAGKFGELNPFYGKRHTDETKANWSRADMSGENNPMFGKPGGMLGKNMSDSAKKKLSESRLGENNPFFGKTHSEETRRKMKEGHLRRKLNNANHLSS